MFAGKKELKKKIVLRVHNRVPLIYGEAWNRDKLDRYIKQQQNEKKS